VNNYNNIPNNGYWTQIVLIILRLYMGFFFLLQFLTLLHFYIIHPQFTNVFYP